MATAEPLRQRAVASEHQPRVATAETEDPFASAPVRAGEHVTSMSDHVMHLGGGDAGMRDGGAADAGADGGTARPDAATGADAGDRPPPALDDGSGCAAGGGAGGPLGMCAFLAACGLLFRRR